MSVESQKPDPSILRKFELSKKEEGLKQKLFKKTQSNTNSLAKTQKSVQNASPKSATVRSNGPFHDVMNVTNIRKEQSVTDEMLGGFLKNMESEFKELNKKQISMGMLQTQQEIMRKHTEILNENQKNIAQMLKEGTYSNQQTMKNSTKLSEDSQKQLMKEIISPINNQIVEIKKMYESTKKLAEDVAHSVGNYRTMVEKNESSIKDPQMFESYQRNIQSTFGDYKAMNSNLKDMVLHAQGNLNQVLPENMQIIKQISDLNIQAYTDCINTLKKQIEGLQRDAEKAEKELEVRYKKLSQIPKPGSIKPTDPYYSLVANGPETSEEVIKNIRAIDFQTSHQIVMNKLGGEFDYEQFNYDISEMVKSIYEIRNKALEDLEEHQIDIPSQLELLEYDKQIASAIPQGHSIIEEIKAKYNVPKQMPLPKPTITPTFTPTYQNTYQAPEDFDAKTSGHLRPKKKTQRPKELDYVRTIPEEPLPDVQFVKTQDPQERIKKRVEFDVEEEPKRAAGPQRTTPPVQREREEETIRRDEYEERRTQAQQREEQPHYYQEERDIREEIRRQEPREETKESLVHINMDRYNVKVNSSQEMKPKDTQELSFDQVKGSDALFNRLFEGMILQDIKEQIVFSNIQPTEEKSEFPQNIRQEHPSIQTRDSGSLQQSSQLYYPQMVSASSNKESSLGGIDEKLIQQLTLETLSEKLLSSLKSELPQEKPKSSSLFQPVESKPLPEVKQQGNNEQINQMASMFGMNSTQLPTMIAENILGLFNAAMMQINTSLSKNMTHPSQIENLSQKQKENIAKTIETYTKKEEQKVPVTQSLPKKETVIQEENIRSSSEYLKPNIFAKPRKEVIQETPQRFDVHQERDLREQVLIREEKPHRAWTEDRRQGSILTALQQEGRNIQEEQEIIRQRKHYVSPGHTLQGNYGVPMQQGYYFLNHDPQPLANLSEYYKELQSDSSSSDLNNTRGVPSQRDISHRDEKRSMGGRRTPSAYDNDLLSEGQVMFPYMEATERTIDSATIDLPNYASSRTMGFGLETDMSIDPRLNSSKKPIITENLFKNLHDEEREPGEISVSDIFKA